MSNFPLANINTGDVDNSLDVNSNINIDIGLGLDSDTDNNFIINNEQNKHNKHNNNNNVKIETIDINDIFWNSLMDNKVILLATIPLFVGYYLQDTVFTRSIATVTVDIPGFINDVDIKKVLILMLPYLIALILFYIANVVTSKTITKIELMTIQELTNKLMDSIRTTKKQINVNELMLHIRTVGDTKSIYNVIVTYLVPTVIIALGLLYNFIQIDTTYSLLLIIIFIIMIFVTAKLEFNSVDRAYDTESSAQIFYDEIHEIMTNIDSVITSNTQDDELRRINDVKNKTFDLACISNLNNSNTTYGLQAISIVAMLGINYLAYRMYVIGRIDAAMLSSTVLLSLLLMDYYNYCIQGIRNLINSMGRYYEMRTYFEEFKIIKYTKEKEDRLITLKTTNGNIIIKNLTVKYDNDTIFDGFNLQIKGHNITGLLGPIGSGKTTLLKVLAGITDYTGHVLVDGQLLENCTYESIVANIAYISQHPKLFNKTIYYNINYGSCYTKNEIIGKLKRLGLMPFINSFSDGLDTPVGKEGSKVSGGQKQFIALIRALIQNKSILLLDEPSSSLDKKNKAIFVQLMKRIKDKTIIISTHDYQIMSLFNTIIDIEKEKDKQSMSIRILSKQEIYNEFVMSESQMETYTENDMY